MTKYQLAVKRYIEEAAEIIGLHVGHASELNPTQWETVLEIAGMLQLEELQHKEVTE